MYVHATCFVFTGLWEVLTPVRVVRGNESSAVHKRRTGNMHTCVLYDNTDAAAAVVRTFRHVAHTLAGCAALSTISVHTTYVHCWLAARLWRQNTTKTCPFPYITNQTNRNTRPQVHHQQSHRHNNQHYNNEQPNVNLVRAREHGQQTSCAGFSKYWICAATVSATVAVIDANALSHDSQDTTTTMLQLQYISFA